MMRFAPGSDERVDAQFLASIDIGLAKVPVVHRHRLRFPDFWRDGREGRNGLLFIVGMIGKRMCHNQQALLIIRYLDIVVLSYTGIGTVFHTAPAVRCRCDARVLGR